MCLPLTVDVQTAEHIRVRLIHRRVKCCVIFSVCLFRSSQFLLWTATEQLRNMTREGGWAGQTVSIGGHWWNQHVPHAISLACILLLRSSMVGITRVQKEKRWKFQIQCLQSRLIRFISTVHLLAAPPLPRVPLGVSRMGCGRRDKHTCYRAFRCLHAGQLTRVKDVISASGPRRRCQHVRVGGFTSGRRRLIFWNRDPPDRPLRILSVQMMFYADDFLQRSETLEPPWWLHMQRCEQPRPASVFV